MKNIPDAAQAAQFDQYVQYWQRVLSLHGWRIERVNKVARGAMACVDFDEGARLATYKLGDFGATPIDAESLCKTALHEVLHVFLHDLIQGAADSRASDDHLEALEHNVINVLERILYVHIQSDGPGIH